MILNFDNWAVQYTHKPKAPVYLKNTGFFLSIIRFLYARSSQFLRLKEKEHLFSIHRQWSN